MSELISDTHPEADTDVAREGANINNCVRKYLGHAHKMTEQMQRLAVGPVFNIFEAYLSSVSW